jgi:hypothetical protein
MRMKRLEFMGAYLNAFATPITTVTTQVVAIAVNADYKALPMRRLTAVYVSQLSCA